MAQEKVRTVIEFFLQRLLEQNMNVSKIILFGSHAAGPPTRKVISTSLSFPATFEGKVSSEE